MPKKESKKKKGVPSLETQTRYVSGVINFPFSETEEGQIDFETVTEVFYSLRAFFNAFSIRWFYALHDRFSEDEGDEVIHLHFVAEFAKRKRLYSWLYAMQNALGYSKPQRSLISVEHCKCLPYAVQYLIHQNHPEKYQFEIDAIQTNVSYPELEDILSSDGSYLDAERIVRLVSCCASKAEILIEVGIDAYSRYRCIFNDLWPVYHNKAYDPMVEKRKVEYVLKA